MQAFKKKIKQLIYSVSTDDRYAEYDEDDHHADLSQYARRGGYNDNNNNNKNYNASTHSLDSSLGNNGSKKTHTQNSFTHHDDLEHSGSSIQLNEIDPDAARMNGSGSVSGSGGGHGQQNDGVDEALLAWKHIESWAAEHSPDLNASFEDSCTRNDITDAEKDLNISFPPSVRASFRIHDGQTELDSYSGVSGVFFGLQLMSLDKIVAMTLAWRNVAYKMQKAGKQQERAQSSSTNDNNNNMNQRQSGGEKFKLNEIPKQGSIPPNTVQSVYAHPSWIPLVTDNAGNHIGVDLAPGPEGVVGQVILFGRDFDIKFVVAKTWGDFILGFANDLIVGNWYLLTDDNDVLAGEGELAFRDKEHGSNIIEDYMNVLKKRSWTAWKQTVDQKQASQVQRHNPQPQQQQVKVQQEQQEEQERRAETQRNRAASGADADQSSARKRSASPQKKNKEINVQIETPRVSVSNDGKQEDVPLEAAEKVAEETAEETAEEPVTEGATEEAAEETAEEPAAEEPVTEEPAAEEPVTEEPVTEEPVTEEPVTEEPAAEEPVTEEPQVEEATEEARVDEPVTEEAAEESEEVAAEDTSEEAAEQSAEVTEADKVAEKFEDIAL